MPLATPLRKPYVSNVLRTLSRLLIALVLVATTSVPGFARMAPMVRAPLAHASVLPASMKISHRTPAALSVCLGGNCAGHHGQGQSQPHQAGMHCIASACTTTAAALPNANFQPTSRAVIATIYTLALTSSRLGVDLRPDAPPPRSITLS